VSGLLASKEKPLVRRATFDEHAIRDHFLDAGERVDECIDKRRRVAILAQYLRRMNDDWLKVHPHIVRDVFGACLVDAFLVLEVILECGRIDTGTCGNVACGRTFETMFTKQLNRRFDDS
jgi:hypothetical protein